MFKTTEVITVQQHNARVMRRLAHAHCVRIARGLQQRFLFTNLMLEVCELRNDAQQFEPVPTN